MLFTKATDGEILSCLKTKLNDAHGHIAYLAFEVVKFDLEEYFRHNDGSSHLAHKINYLETVFKVLKGEYQHIRKLAHTPEELAHNASTLERLIKRTNDMMSLFASTMNVYQFVSAGTNGKVYNDMIRIGTNLNQFVFEYDDLLILNAAATSYLMRMNFRELNSGKTNE